MIADSGKRENIPEILEHYDTLLRTSSSSATLILPIMAGALSSDKFIEPFADLLATRPPWADRFWNTAVGIPEAIGNAATLRTMLYKSGENRQSYADAELISALINNQQFDRAEALYDVLTGGRKSGSRLNNGSFKGQPVYPPIDWQLFTTGSYGASIENGKLLLSAIRNSGGMFARQIVKLPQTQIEIQVLLAEEIPDRTELVVNLRCAEKSSAASQSARIKLEKNSTIRKINNADSGCNYYWLEIAGRASDEGAGFDVAIDSVSLRAI